MSLNKIFSQFSVMAAVAFALVAISSCEEDTLNIGQTLTDRSDKLQMGTESYVVSTQTIIADSVLALSSDCYLGSVIDPETESCVISEFTTQFHLLETTYISPEEKIVGRFNGIAAADSCDILLYLSTPFRLADSLVAMKICTKELGVPLEEGLRYYSNFDPEASGMLRTGGLVKPTLYSYANLTMKDSERTDDNYQPCIRITLNEPYLAPNNVIYNNFGTYLLRQYYDHPDYFRNSYTFAHHVCPGFLFQILDGQGFHAHVSNIGLRTFYTIQGDTSIINGGIVLAGTREVLQTTHVINDRQALEAMAAQTEHTYLKTPAGLFTEVTLPIIDIKQGHEGDSLLAAKLIFQRLNNQDGNERALPAPQALLMVQKDSLYSFFENSRVPDNITSYYTGYNNPSPTSTTYYKNDNTYTFSNLSSLVTTLWNQRQRGLLADPSWEAHHPDWNKMVLVPVTYTTSSASSSVTSMHHDMSLTSTRLVGGPDNPNDPIMISVVYANFK
jgi:hypothetical protein